MTSFFIIEIGIQLHFIFRAINKIMFLNRKGLFYYLIAVKVLWLNNVKIELELISLF